MGCHKAWVIAMSVENPQSSGWFAPSPCNILSQPLAIIPQGSPIYEDYEDPMLNKTRISDGWYWEGMIPIYARRPTRSNGLCHSSHKPPCLLQNTSASLILCITSFYYTIFPLMIPSSLYHNSPILILVFHP